MSKRWRIYCTEPDDEGWKYVWSDSAPTECPDDPEKPVNLDSVRQDMKEVPLYKMRPSVQKIKSKNLESVGICYFDPSDFEGTLRRAKILSHLDKDSTSYDFEVYDRKNNIRLVKNTFTNKNRESEEMVTDVIISPPSNSTILEFNIKKIGGGNKTYVWIDEISLYFAVPF